MRWVFRRSGGSIGLRGRVMREEEQQEEEKKKKRRRRVEREE